MNKIFFHSFSFLLFFTLFYFESIEIYSVKIAVIWKILLIGLIIIFILFSKPVKISKVIFWGYLYSIKNLFTISLFQYYYMTITESLKFLVIPLFMHLLGVLMKYKHFYIRMYKIHITMSIYIILSTLPFLFGFIKPMTQGYRLDIFGLESIGFVGIFQVAHSASFAIAFAIIVLIGNYKYKKTNIQKTLYLILIIIGLFCELLTFVRTGFAMIIAAFMYQFLRGKRTVYYLKMIPIVLVIIVSFVAFYQHSDVYRMRIRGSNIYTEQKQINFNTIGSGRYGFAKAALDNWVHSGIYGVILGLGREKAMKLMKELYGFQIYAHNGFIDILQFNGLVGALIYIMFYYFLYLSIKKGKKKVSYLTTMMLFVAYSVGMLFQGEHFFLVDLLLAITIVSHICYNGNQNRYKQY